MAAGESEPGAAPDDTADAAQKQNLKSPANDRAGEVMPLQFLLAVMRDPDTPANLRFRIASLVARYVHPRRSTNGYSKVVVEDPTGFSIDPTIAVELREAKRRYG